MKVLVVEDQADARDLLVTVLAAAGAQVTSASSAVDARAAFARTRPDVLVSDIAMPREGGYELIRTIRNWGPDGDNKIPAIAVTALAAPEDRALALAAGYDVHLAKPIDPQELVRLVHRLVGGRPSDGAEVSAPGEERGSGRPGNGKRR